jgi:hypothetical protein
MVETKIMPKFVGKGGTDVNHAGIDAVDLLCIVRNRIWNLRKWH